VLDVCEIRFGCATVETEVLEEVFEVDLDESDVIVVDEAA